MLADQAISNLGATRNDVIFIYIFYLGATCYLGVTRIYVIWELQGTMLSWNYQDICYLGATRTLGYLDLTRQRLPGPNHQDRGYLDLTTRTEVTWT